MQKYSKINYGKILIIQKKYINLQSKSIECIIEWYIELDECRCEALFKQVMDDEKEM